MDQSIWKPKKPVKNELDNKKVYLSVRMDAETHLKLSRVATSEHRSLRGQIIYLIHKNIKEFESEHGPIDLDGK